MKELLETKDQALAYLKPVQKEIMKWFRNDYKVETKSDDSPVTIADRTAEEMLRKRIGRDFPEHGIIGEEFGEEDSNREWVWTIDPIDGTRSFIRGLPLFSTLLSLLHKGKPVMGIIQLPALGETAWAVKGQGAWCNSKAIRVSKESSIQKATLATADVYCFREKKQMKFHQQLHQQAQLVRTYPDAFGHMMAIRGVVDAMIDPWAYIWDFAPVKILAEEAGGAFVNLNGNKKDISEGSALVGNKKLVQSIKKLASG